MVEGEVIGLHGFLLYLKASFPVSLFSEGSRSTVTSYNIYLFSVNLQKPWGNFCEDKTATNICFFLFPSPNIKHDLKILEINNFTNKGFTNLKLCTILKGTRKKNTLSRSSLCGICVTHLVYV